LSNDIMKAIYRLPKLATFVLALALACCSRDDGTQSGLPSSGAQQAIAAPLAVFAPVAAAPAPVAAPPSVAASNAAPSMGIAGMTQADAPPGNASRGRDFAFDNCRPCHVVAPNQASATRFSNAPDFHAVANMPSTTQLSLVVWLTNPHPTMPSLVLSPQEAADVIAYIQSMRDRP
jgi:mono/diheme cytochrome c family protein